MKRFFLIALVIMLTGCATSKNSAVWKPELSCNRSSFTTHVTGVVEIIVYGEITVEQPLHIVYHPDDIMEQKENTALVRLGDESKPLGCKQTYGGLVDLRPRGGVVKIALDRQGNLISIKTFRKGTAVTGIRLLGDPVHATWLNE